MRYQVSGLLLLEIMIKRVESKVKSGNSRHWFLAFVAGQNLRTKTLFRRGSPITKMRGNFASSEAAMGGLDPNLTTPHSSRSEFSCEHALTENLPMHSAKNSNRVLMENTFFF